MLRSRIGERVPVCEVRNLDVDLLVINPCIWVEDTQLLYPHTDATLYPLLFAVLYFRTSVDYIFTPHALRGRTTSAADSLRPTPKGDSR